MRLPKRCKHVVLLSRFSDDWDRIGLNERTIVFTRTRSSHSARAHEWVRTEVIARVTADA